LYRRLTNHYKNEPRAKELNIFLTEQIAEVGKPLIDFEVKTIAGKPFRLSSLKGKYIFMSFGSLGCGPCRMENQEIREKYDRLSKHIQFVYFSLDPNRSYWERITKEDKIVWTNISGKKGDYGRVKNIYGVQAMPTSFLIDKDGIIVKKIEAYDTETLTQLEKMLSDQN
jgi:peroxiredoxin